MSQSASFIREPAVAGRMYAQDAVKLRGDVEWLLSAAIDERPATAVIAPHASFRDGGAVAGETYGSVVVPERVVLLCPNHTGAGARRSLWPSGAWRTPLGDALVDEELGAQIGARARLVDDLAAHEHEHAAEVHLPFLLAKQPELRIVPICLGELMLTECIDLGEAIADAIAASGRSTLVVATTELSHGVSPAEAMQRDHCAIDHVLGADATGLYRAAQRGDVSMCGYVPSAIALVAARALGANASRLVRYDGESAELARRGVITTHAGVVVGQA